MTIGIISAMDSEHRRLVERLQDKNTSGDGSFRYVEGTLGGNHVILTQCGIGKVSAAVGASELIRRFSPDCIVSTGVAGGIDACLKVTDVVASQRLVYHDVWCGDGNEYGQVQGFPPLTRMFLSVETCLVAERSRNGKPHPQRTCLYRRPVHHQPYGADTIKQRFLTVLPLIWSLPPLRRLAICTMFLFSASASSATHPSRGPCFAVCRFLGNHGRAFVPHDMDLPLHPSQQFITHNL